jgi:hypothetical protein|tara:strand:- start:1426 stop:1800 length:375 start_codon:yes stop_codon:yes gene_type:complete
MSLLLNTLVEPVTGLLDKFIPDADKKAKLAHEIATLSEKQHQEIMLQQIELAKIEAQGSMLQRTWRPMIGHCCWIGLMYNVIISPFLGIWLPVPEIQSDLLYPVLLGMLGMSGIRGVERVKGKA